MSSKLKTELKAIKGHHTVTVITLARADSGFEIGGGGGMISMVDVRRSGALILDPLKLAIWCNLGIIIVIPAP